MVGTLETIGGRVGDSYLYAEGSKQGGKNGLLL